MSMAMIHGLYNSYAAQNANSSTMKREADNRTKAAEEGSRGSGLKEPQLSKAAQNLLEKLKNTYDNMDFMVMGEGDDPKELLSRGTKEISVIFSSEELERMAADEKVEKKYMGRVHNALRMSDEINKKFGFGSAFGKDSGKGEITKIGISFNQDGTTTLFAELEQSSAKQRERIEEGREKRAEEQEASVKKEHEDYKKKDAPVKKTTVEAASEEELFEKIAAVDWKQVQEERKMTGGKFDLSV